MNQKVLGESDKQILAAIVDATPGPALVVEGPMRLVVCNEEARAMLPGLRVGDSLAMGVRSPEVLEAVRRVSAGGTAERVALVERVPVERVFEVSVAPAPIDSVRLVVIVMRDLTEAHRIDRMRSDFIANASHELRTPLASLLGFIETLQGPARDDALARERFLGIMRDQAQRMSRLIDDLLSLSRIEQTLHVRPQGEVDLVSVTRHVIDTLAPLVEETGASVSFHGPPSAVVAGDRDELIRVAENLIENALKYGGRADAAPRVRVEIARDGAQTALSVADDGPGVAPEHAPRLTERFFRVDAGASRAKGGSGLGLSIVKHILARHRGRLRIESAPGAGSRFTAYFPGG